MAHAVKSESEQFGIDSTAVFVEVVLIGENDVLMHLLAFQKISSFLPCGHGLGHSTHHKVGAKLIHQFVVEWGIERMLCSCLTAHSKQSLHVHCHKELVEGHRVHKYAMDSAHTEGRETLKGELQQ